MGRGKREERETSYKRILRIEDKVKVDGGLWVGVGLDG